MNSRKYSKELKSLNEIRSHLSRVTEGDEIHLPSKDFCFTVLKSPETSTTEFGAEWTDIYVEGNETKFKIHWSNGSNPSLSCVMHKSEDQEK